MNAEQFLPRWVSIIKVLGSVLFVPVIIAIIGWNVQKAIKNQSIERDYVQIAVSILIENNTEPALRAWAIELLNKMSPVPFQQTLISDFGSGTLSFPTSTALFLNASPEEFQKFLDSLRR